MGDGGLGREPRRFRPEVKCRARFPVARPLYLRAPSISSSPRRRADAVWRDAGENDITRRKDCRRERFFHRKHDPDQTLEIEDRSGQFQVPRARRSRVLGRQDRGSATQGRRDPNGEDGGRRSRREQHSGQRSGKGESAREVRTLASVRTAERASLRGRSQVASNLSHNGPTGRSGRVQPVPALIHAAAGSAVVVHRDLAGRVAHPHQIRDTVAVEVCRGGDLPAGRA